MRVSEDRARRPAIGEAIFNSGLRWTDDNDEVNFIYLL
jgi:hypothetical protein